MESNQGFPFQEFEFPIAESISELESDHGYPFPIVESNSELAGNQGFPFPMAGSILEPHNNVSQYDQHPQGLQPPSNFVALSSQPGIAITAPTLGGATNHPVPQMFEPAQFKLFWQLYHNAFLKAYVKERKAWWIARLNNMPPLQKIHVCELMGKVPDHSIAESAEKLLQNVTVEIWPCRLDKSRVNFLAWMNEMDWEQLKVNSDQAEQAGNGNQIDVVDWEQVKVNSNQMGQAGNGNQIDVADWEQFKVNSDQVEQAGNGNQIGVVDWEQFMMDGPSKRMKFT